MTTKNSYCEVDFNTTWQMYENQAVIPEPTYGKVKLGDMSIGRDDLAKDGLYPGPGNGQRVPVRRVLVRGTIESQGFGPGFFYQDGRAVQRICSS